MKKTDLAKFKKVLEEQLVELQKDASVKLVEANSNNSALPDVNDQASFETERNFELRIKDRERKLISKYQKVLRKIDDGTYGVCESCGEEIVLPIDLSAGSEQKYVEDCPVCCHPQVIHIELDDDGDADAWGEAE